MNWSRLVTWLVILAISYHARRAFESRLLQVVHIYRTAVVQHQMRIILRAAVYETLSDEPGSLGDLATFARATMSRRMDGGDPGSDPWGNAFRHRLLGGRFLLQSAGPDKAWDTRDDIVMSERASQISGFSTE